MITGRALGEIGDKGFAVCLKRVRKLPDNDFDFFKRGIDPLAMGMREDPLSNVPENTLGLSIEVVAENIVVTVLVIFPPDIYLIQCEFGELFLVGFFDSLTASQDTVTRAVILV